MKRQTTELFINQWRKLQMNCVIIKCQTEIQPFPSLNLSYSQFILTFFYTLQTFINKNQQSFNSSKQIQKKQINKIALPANYYPFLNNKYYPYLLQISLTFELFHFFSFSFLPYVFQVLYAFYVFYVFQVFYVFYVFYVFQVFYVLSSPSLSAFNSGYITYLQNQCYNYVAFQYRIIKHYFAANTLLCKYVVPPDFVSFFLNSIQYRFKIYLDSTYSRVLFIFNIRREVDSFNGGADKFVLDIIDEKNVSNTCCFCPEFPPEPPCFALEAVVSLYALKNDFKTGIECCFMQLRTNLQKLIFI